jgi:small subunit ribosomal protein S24e
LNIEIEGKKENPLLERTEINLRIDHQGTGTPTRDEIRNQLAGMLGAKADAIVIDNMHTEFGHQLTVAYAKVYSSVDSAKKFEKDHLLTRNKIGGEEAKE